MGDAHAAQGDSELDGTGIETSITGTFKIAVIKQANFTPAQDVLDFPLGETETHWIVHGYVDCSFILSSRVSCQAYGQNAYIFIRRFTETDYLDTFFDDPSQIYGISSIDKAAFNAFTQTRKFLMAQYSLTEAEVWTIVTQGVDFRLTQIVDGNFGVHAIIPKSVFVEFTEEDRARIGSSGRKRKLNEQVAELKLSPETVHWGFFSKNLTPVLTVTSGDEVVVEMATHHACDDYDAMILGDESMESIYAWTEEVIGEEFRGATGMGDGVHILTGPIFVEGAEPGDLLQVEIIDLAPRPNIDGRTYGSNAAAWWGFQARVDKTDGTPFTAGSFTDTPDSNDEIVTIYEVLESESEPGEGYAVPVYQFEWPVITDPMGTERDYIAYPGTCVPHDPHGGIVPSGAVESMGWTKAANITYYDDVFKAKIPINFHIGCMGLPPASHDAVDSIPPMPTGGNLDNKRIGIG